MRVVLGEPAAATSGRSNHRQTRRNRRRTSKGEDPWQTSWRQRGGSPEQWRGADGVEIKATIPEKQVDPALHAYGLSLSDSERYIYFFDTPELELLETGVIARARRIVGAQHDSTIKFRPVLPASIPSLWRKYSGFKIEADWSEKGVVKSASLTMPVVKGLIKRVAGGNNPIADLFTEEQVLFLPSLATKKIDYSRVVVLGPYSPLEMEIQASRIALADYRRAPAAARRSPSVPSVNQGARRPGRPAAGAGFMAFLAEVGAVCDNGQQVKTRWALDFAASHLSQLPPPVDEAVPAKKTPRSAGKK